MKSNKLHREEKKNPSLLFLPHVTWREKQSLYGPSAAPPR